MAIKEPDLRTVTFRINGNAPYVQAAFSVKARMMMEEKMLAGSKAKKGKNKEARDFDDDYKQAQHRSADGWNGMPASAFRAALISACRLVGFKMTLAKLSVFVEADGYDAVDATPLVRIIGDPKPLKVPVRNATGVADIRVRPVWHEWTADVRVRYDADQFSQDDVFRLMKRVGLQVGIGEGRPDSRESAGQGWGTFSVEVVG